MANIIQRTKSFYHDTVGELKKCTWPTWNELWESTLVVIISSVMLSVFVFAMDALVRTVVRFAT